MTDDKLNNQQVPPPINNQPNTSGPTFGTPNQGNLNNVPNFGGGYGAVAPQNSVELEHDEDGYVVFPKAPITPVENKSHSLNNWLSQNVSEFIPCKSLYENKKVSYDTFLKELNYDLFDLILKTNLLKTKPIVTKIKKQLIYVLVSTKDLPDLERDLVFNTTLRFVDFLKTVVYYPETEKINEEVIAYLPILKEVAIAFKNFLMKNR